MCDYDVDKIKKLEAELQEARREIVAIKQQITSVLKDLSWCL